MIIVNGTLQTIETTGGGMLHGIPIPVEETEGMPVECNIRTVKHDRKGTVVDGTFTQSSYEILIEEQEFNANRILLKDDRGNTLGKYEVQDVQHLNAVYAVKITV